MIYLPATVLFAHFSLPACLSMSPCSTHCSIFQTLFLSTCFQTTQSPFTITPSSTIVTTARRFNVECIPASAPHFLRYFTSASSAPVRCSLSLGPHCDSGRHCCHGKRAVREDKTDHLRANSLFSHRLIPIHDAMFMAGFGDTGVALSMTGCCHVPASITSQVGIIVSRIICTVFDVCCSGATWFQSILQVCSSIVSRLRFPFSDRIDGLNLQNIFSSQLFIHNYFRAIMQ